MAGYNDTRQLIIDTLMGRPAGTEIQPEDHQAFALQITDYIRSVELMAGNSVPIAFADIDTVPVQPDSGQAVYFSFVPKGETKTFKYFIGKDGNEIMVSSTANEVSFVILLWNGSYWSSQKTSIPLTIDIITTDNIADGAVTNKKLADKAVTSDKIADEAIISDKIRDGAVTNGKIAEGAVTSGKIRDGAVTNGKIAEGAVTSDKISSIKTGNIENGAVTNEKLAVDSVTNDKIADEAIISDKIRDGAVTNGKIAEGAVTSDKIADEAITGDKLAKDSVITNIAEGAITGAKIADEAITSGKIRDGAVTGAKIAEGVITPNKLDTAYLPLAGGTLKGNLNVVAPTEDTSATTKKYVDSQVEVAQKSAKAAEASAEEALKTFLALEINETTGEVSATVGTETVYSDIQTDSTTGEIIIKQIY